MVNLCIDIGNSFYKVAVFESKIRTFERFEKFLIRDLKAIHAEWAFERVILSSTRKDNKILLNHLEKNYDFIHLSHKTKLPFTNLYETPKTLGRDRIAGIAGAQKMFPKTNCLVIDAGTCITYDFINRQGKYLGGNIAPGARMRLRAMDEFTDKLPLASYKFNKDILGKTTNHALENGAMWGTICEMEAFMERIDLKYKDLNVILTGGDASLFAQKLKRKIFVSPELVMIGLNEILEYNA